MAFDGIFLHKLKKEIEETAVGSRIEKIYQPSRDELVLLLRKKGFSEKLYISARPSFAKLYYTKQSFENPAVPPMFCMLLRKHLTSAKLLSIEETGFERIAIFNFENTNEMGDRVTLKLVIEMMGSKTNIILVSEDGRIVDATRRSSFENLDRLIQPGAIYCLPQSQNKISPLGSPSVLTETICGFEGQLSKAILSSVEGMSPLVAREIVFWAGIEDTQNANELTAVQKEKLEGAIKKLQDAISQNTPTMLFKDENIFDFTFLNILQYGETIKSEQKNSFSALLDEFFSSKEKGDRIGAASSELLKLLNTLRARVVRKIGLRKKDMEKCQNAEIYRIYGELIKANLHNIQRGMNSVSVENYYDEMKVIEIPLNVTLSPVENSQKYFKEYRKSCTALATLGELIEDGERELEYIESVIDALSRATTVSQLEEIKAELSFEGYLPKLPSRRQKAVKFKFEEHKSPSGFKVLVGKNNAQNEELTLRMATKQDMWFHVKNIPGSHVVVFCGDKELSDDDVLFAAKLAAKNSKAAESSQVAVDYTPVKQIKKPAGSKCGMVIYYTNKTVYVTP